MDNEKIILLLLILLIFYIYFNYRKILNGVETVSSFAALPNKYIIKDNEMMCILPNHIFYINPLDSIISYVLKCGNYWESWMHYYFKKFSDKNKVCLDIGANIGCHSVILSNYFSKVYAFEPQKDVFKLLKKNILVNDCQNVVINDFGLSDKESTAKMRCFDENKPVNIGSIGITDDENGCETIQIKTLDTLNIQDIGFIKIDIEGHEYNAFIGGLNTIKKNKPVIIFEEHNKKSKVFNLIESLNYKIEKISYTNDYLALPF